MTQKHIKTATRGERRASDMDVTKSIQVVQAHFLPVRCKCTKTFLAHSPADLRRGRSQLIRMKRNTKINNREEVYFPMEEQQRIIQHQQ